MKNAKRKVILTAFASTAALFSCANPFFGEEVRSAHFEQEEYTPPQYERLSPPSTVIATENEIDKIVLTWSKVSVAAEYRVYRSESADSGFKLLVEVQDPTFTDTGAILSLKSGLSYYYKIACVSVEGIESALSTAVVGRCYLSNGEVIPPPEVIASQGAFQDKIEVKWTDVPTALYYRVFRSETDEAGSFEAAEAFIADNVSETVFVDTDVELGKVYYYKIQSVGASPEPGAEPVSSTLSVSGSGYLASLSVGAVEGFSASVDISNGVYLKWNPVDFPVEIFRAEAQSVDGSESEFEAVEDFVLLAEVETGISSYSDVKTNMKEKPYLYKIQAVKSDSERGILSEAVVGHVPITPPVITLIGGEETLIIDLNKTPTPEDFTDPGCTAMDDFDGDVTARVVTDLSALDFNKLSDEQVITYKVSDAAGNETIKERKVQTVFLPDLSNAVIERISSLPSLPTQSTTFRISGLEPAQVPQKFGANYVYTWTVEDGTASGSGADGALVIDFAGNTSIEKKITVSVGTNKDDQRVDFSETEEFKISALADVGSDFNTAGEFAPFTADYKLVWKNWSFGYVWDLETGSEYHNEGNPLTGDTWYKYLGSQKELIVSTADGSFVMGDTSKNTDVAGMGDAAETAVTLNGPEFNVVGGVTYKVSARIYRAADSKADVFVTVGSKEALVPTAEGWHDIAFDYTPAADLQTSLKVWKMPVGVRDWSAITGGEDGNLKTGSDMKEVKVDSISIRYADKADEPSEA
mgnify:CR=1 FL=1